MSKKWYEIIGLTPAMLKEWKDDMRKDVVVWEQDGIVHVHIELTWLEALKLRRQINRNNMKTEPHYYFRLARVD